MHMLFSTTNQYIEFGLEKFYSKRPIKLSTFLLMNVHWSPPSIYLFYYLKLKHLSVRVGNLFGHVSAPVEIITLFQIFSEFSCIFSPNGWLVILKLFLY